MRESARFPPIACTVTLDELVTLPSSSARTAPFTTDRDAYRPSAAKPPSAMLSTTATASLRATTSDALPPAMRSRRTSDPRNVCALLRSAVTFTAPLLAMEAVEPTVAWVYAPLVTSASA